MKNTLSDLNNYLFETIERLQDDELDEEHLNREIRRAEAVTKVSEVIVRNGELTLGPFQGKAACIRIGKGKGVCGTAWDRDETVVVPDVHQFPGHIACDSASRSEIVIPVHRNGEVFAVLDIDSPTAERFGEEDKKGLEQIVKCIEEGLT